MTIRDRILTALNGKKSAEYSELMSSVFPQDKYPKAYNYQQNGGPPGCAMAFGKALRLMGAKVYGMGSQRKVYF